MMYVHCGLVKTTGNEVCRKTRCCCSQDVLLADYKSMSLSPNPSVNKSEGNLNHK